MMGFLNFIAEVLGWIALGAIALGVLVMVIVFCIDIAFGDD